MEQVYETFNIKYQNAERSFEYYKYDRQRLLDAVKKFMLSDSFEKEPSKCNMRSKKIGSIMYVFDIKFNDWRDGISRGSEPHIFYYKPFNDGWPIYCFSTLEVKKELLKLYNKNVWRECVADSKTEKGFEEFKKEVAKLPFEKNSTPGGLTLIEVLGKFWQIEKVKLPFLRETFYVVFDPKKSGYGRMSTHGGCL